MSDLSVISLFLVLGAVTLVQLGMYIHGTVLSFKKSWLAGFTALVFPLFATAVSFSKLVLKKNILN